MSKPSSFEDFKNSLLNKDVPPPAKPKQESFETFKNRILGISNPQPTEK
ncbi:MULTISPECIES: hypothetical protein [Nostoc]|uniref:Uncharacterized protein n=2 Tax=Nostoc TaxID=1177 RepID=A0ABR8IMD3_9NOSO|nr:MULTISPECIES: hypothetical protein [Nostoc]MBD2566074.1 hypothetical protein [Nostoc linckia FACHB-391]MBD2651675.1 hypothetical protein [Nostoc foliaceum FACHB-393]